MPKDQKDPQDLQVSHDHEVPNDRQDAIGRIVLAPERLLLGDGACAKKFREIG